MSFGRKFSTLAAFTSLAGSTAAEVMFGPDARTLFDSLRDSGAVQHEDFENIAPGPLSELAGGEVTLKTTENRFGGIRPLDLPVVVLPWDFVNAPAGVISPIRSGAPRYIPDGQNKYEMRFSSPKLRAGITRLWNTSTITRFFNGDTLLAEHQNTAGTEFVAYVGDLNDPNDRVTHIEIDGLQDGNVYQVGFSDDLFWGDEPGPPPAFDPAIRLTFDPGNDYGPVWDPRGEIIAFSTDRTPGDWRDIGGINADGSGEALLATGPQTPFGLGPGPYSWVGATGQLVVNETVSGHEYLSFDVSMAPFTRTAFNGSDAAFTPKLVINGGGGGGFFKVSRDGSTALWRYSASGGGGRTTVRTAPYASLTGQGASSHGTIHLDQTPPSPAQYSLQGMALSPDGSFLIIALEAGTGYDLWRYQTDGSVEPLQLTNSGPSGAFNRLMEISPNGRTIAYTYFSGIEGETNEIYLMNVDGTNVRNLTNTPDISEANPTWSPDGQWLAYQRTDPEGSSFLAEGEVPSSNIFKRAIDPADLLLKEAFVGTFLPTRIDVEGEINFGMQVRWQAGGSFEPDMSYRSKDFIYVLEKSTDLTNWDPAGTEVTLTPIIAHEDGTETVVSSVPRTDVTTYLRMSVARRPTD